MKRLFLFLSIGLFLSAPVLAKGDCFLAKENDKVLVSEGDCKTRHAPCSTFKIALALIGYDAGILEDETNPSFPCKKEYDTFINVCKGAHTPKTWMRDSCLWYSRVLTGKLGMQKFKEYVIKLNYGNQDLSGDHGKNNGITNAWISSSLNISPEEQIDFLKKLIDNKLPISQKSHEMTKKIMFMQELPGGWKLYGKTGNGSQLDHNKQKTDLQHGWFVGWIEKDGRRIIFASHLADSNKQDTFASFRIKNEALVKLWYLINDQEK